MNLYSAIWDVITYDDVLAFLQGRPPENLFIDYKREVGGGLEKDIASFANTRGGLIFIGIEEDADRRPILPPNGVPKRAKWVEDIGQIDTGNIWPPTSPEVRVFDIPGSERVLVAIRIRESEIAPHWQFQKNKVYVRHISSTQFTVDVTLANENELEFLLGKREKSRSFLAHRIAEIFKLNDSLFITGSKLGFRGVIAYVNFWPSAFFPTENAPAVLI